MTTQTPTGTTQTFQFVKLGDGYPLSHRIDARLATYDRGGTFLPPSFTLSAGREHRNGLVVELPSPGASIQIQSPVIAGDASKTSLSRVSLAGSAATIDAPLYAASQFVVPRAEDSSMGAIT